MSDPNSPIAVSPFDAVVPLGAAVYGAGLHVLTVYPRATGYYWVYWGANETRAVSKTLEAAISDSGMRLLSVDRIAPPLPASSQFYSNSPIARLGNAATIDTANTVAAQYGSSLGDFGMDLTAVRDLPQNTYTFANGDTFRPDLSYRTSSWWSGSTLHFDETKAVANLTASSRNLNQVANYGRAISEINAASSGMRLLGAALRTGGTVLGAAGAVYDVYHTGSAISADLNRNYGDSLPNRSCRDVGSASRGFGPHLRGASGRADACSRRLIQSRDPIGRPVVSERRRAAKAQASSKAAERKSVNGPTRSSTGAVVTTSHLGRADARLRSTTANPLLDRQGGHAQG
jgi:hypothetical protein